MQNMYIASESVVKQLKPARARAWPSPNEEINLPIFSLLPLCHVLELLKQSEIARRK